jgi:hypothetical protein
MNKPCEYCGCDLPLGVDKKTRQHRSHHFATCKARPVCEVETPAQQEPVAWIDMSQWPPIRWRDGLLRTDVDQFDGQGLYTSPPASKPWVGLDDTDLAVCDTDGVRLARYWERVLREKNT